MKRISPLKPQDRKGCALDLPLPAPAGTMLPTLRKELPSKPVATFDLVCSLLRLAAAAHLVRKLT